MKQKYKNRYTGKTIFEYEAETFREGLVIAVGLKVDLSRSSLSGSDLSRSNLRGADLREADLRRADLSGADLREADLRRADLSGSNLSGAKLNWNSHQLLSEILRRASNEDFTKISFAGAVRIHTSWCWERWQKETPPETWDWMLSVFSDYVVDGDDAPAVVTDWKKAHESK